MFQIRDINGNPQFGIRLDGKQRTVEFYFVNFQGRLQSVQFNKLRKVSNVCVLDVSFAFVLVPVVAPNPPPPPPPFFSSSSSSFFLRLLLLLDVYAYLKTFLINFLKLEYCLREFCESRETILKLTFASVTVWLCPFPHDPEDLNRPVVRSIVCVVVLGCVLLLTIF